MQQSGHLISPLRAIIAGGLALGLLGPGTAAAADPPKGAPERVLTMRADSSASHRPIPATAPANAIIVKFRPGANRTDARRAARVDRVRRLTSIGAEVVRPRGRSIEEALAALRARPDVEYAEPDIRRAAFVDPRSEPYFQYQWGLDNTGQLVGGSPGTPNVDIDGLEALAVTGGDPGIVVAVIDEGVDFSHPDLDGAAWVNPGEIAGNSIDDDNNGYTDDVNGWDFCNNDGTVHDVDVDDHGTAVAGTIGADIDSNGIAGVAPGVRIMSLKFLDDDHPLACNTVSQEIAAIEYAKSFGVRIANASFGAYDPSPPERDAIASSGMLFVVAAGNEGLNNDVYPSYPASYPETNILSVAAMDKNGYYSLFSNYGNASVDLAAPGEEIQVAVPATSTELAGWELWDGTSFAAPHVTGVAALTATVRPSLLADPVGLKARILATVWGGDPGVGTVTGGALDALWAVDAPTATAPTASFLVPSTLGSSSATLRVAWPAAVDDDGAVTHTLQQRVNGGAWTTVGAPTAAGGAVNRSVTLGATYQFRIAAVDQLGSAVVAESAPLRALRYQESSSAISYRGTWYRFASSSASGGRTKYATRATNHARFTFVGTGVAFVAPRSRARGSARIYLDNVLVKTVSLYSSTSKSRQVLFQRTGLAYGTHSLRVVVVGTRGHPRVDVDAFVILR